ncbi:trypsin-like peptidase domain-containing protein [Candidatus Poriferisocius sp.]|uniref:trypsin-like peptidase domain-containing protein n=1 Tax=Candidatus Poriferisocius sp. TaxID=3101276 RepID=UPI003B01F7C0
MKTLVGVVLVLALITACSGSEPKSAPYPQAEVDALEAQNDEKRATIDDQNETIVEQRSTIQAQRQAIVEQQDEIDRLIAAQETLLNTYRCQFDIETQKVPDGCQEGTLAAQPRAETQSTVETLTATQIYELLAPSIAYVESATLTGIFGESTTLTGSGILVEGGYLVTNFHVVWPHQQVRVVFPDGTEFEEVPVAAHDYVADIALLGPIEIDAPAVVLSDGEDMPLGSDLFLIGYPAEYEPFPQPSITKGILNRFRQWDTYELTLLQTDAAITGGQSGGALVNTRGQVVGISTWIFGGAGTILGPTGAGFGVASSASDVADIVDGLIRVATLRESGGFRGVSALDGEFVFEVDPVTPQAFTFTSTAGSHVEITLLGASDGIVSISNSLGVLAEADQTTTGEETLFFEVPDDGTYFVVVYSWGNDTGDYNFDLISSVPLQPYEDPDDDADYLGRGGWKVDPGTVFDLVVSSGGGIGGWNVGSRTTTFGLFDYYSDIDAYTIILNAGEVYSVSTESVFADTEISIFSPERESFNDDDSGHVTVLGNTFNALVEFTAPTTGEYIVWVSEVLDRSGDGYALIVERLA